MIKVLFFLSTLGNGGAEKVLVNLVNYMDKKIFDITVMTLFDEGENRSLLAPHIKYRACISKSRKGLVHLMKCLSPKQLHKLFVKETYDLEISYLEGVATRIISGCQNHNTKTLAWVHTEFVDEKFARRAYRNNRELAKCYKNFDKIVCVSEQVRERFCSLFEGYSEKTIVQYNTNDSDLILKLAYENISDINFSDEEFKIIAVGKIIKNKGFDRLARVLNKLKNDGIYPHVYIIGEGEDKEKIKKYIAENDMDNLFTFIGYKKNPYKYIRKCDLFVCTSYREGFSTATTEALILGVPVLTVDVSGMKELLGENNQFGIIVPNDEESLYLGLKEYISDVDLHNQYRNSAKQRGLRFNRDITVKETENLLMELITQKNMSY